MIKQLPLLLLLATCSKPPAPAVGHDAGVGGVVWAAANVPQGRTYSFGVETKSPMSNGTMRLHVPNLAGTATCARIRVAAQDDAGSSFSMYTEVELSYPWRVELSYPWLSDLNVRTVQRAVLDTDIGAQTWTATVVVSRGDLLLNVAAPYAHVYWTASEELTCTDWSPPQVKTTRDPMIDTRSLTIGRSQAPPSIIMFGSAHHQPVIEIRGNGDFLVRGHLVENDALVYRAMVDFLRGACSCPQACR